MGRIKCLGCGAILESKSRHDFVMCKCDNKTFVEGDNDYLKAGGKDLDKIKIMPENDPYLPEQATLPKLSWWWRG